MKETNYKGIFFSGITFVGAGVVFMTSVNVGLGAAFIGIGIMFMIIGGKNKDKWKK
ncbi:hypothetical protein KY358_03610 [Candidatus Woesearchaeota archaeon]|nr:hypothetical protein [Candidatus Woesearchaeota archaeon]